MPTVPRGRDAMGQYNIFYAYDASGTRKNASWIWNTFDLLNSYHKGNLLIAPEAEADGEIFDMQERAWGFQSNAQIRRSIEEHAMNVAKEELQNLGFSNFKRTAERECYDYMCEYGESSYYVEVKGTQTPGMSVILTRNEVEHAKQFPNNSIFVIVHSVKVRRNGSSFHVSEGLTRVHSPWTLRSDTVEPIHFKWILPGT